MQSPVAKTGSGVNLSKLPAHVSKLPGKNSLEFGIHSVYLQHIFWDVIYIQSIICGWNTAYLQSISWNIVYRQSSWNVVYLQSSWNGNLQSIIEASYVLPFDVLAATLLFTILVICIPRNTSPVSLALWMMCHCNRFSQCPQQLLCLRSNASRTWQNTM